MNSKLEHILIGVVRKELPGVFLMLDEHQIVVEANLHTRALLGDDVVGAEVTALLASFHRDLKLQSLVNSAAHTHKLNFTTCAGLVQTLECHIFAYPQGFIILGGVDQREQEMMRAELLASNRELSNRRRELQKVLNQVAHLSQLKDRFLAMAAHDLRHPIQTIQLIADMAVHEGERSKPECLRDFQEIGEANRLMGKVVDGFLSLAVLQSGSIRLDGQKTDLQLLVEQTIGLLRRTAERKGVQLQLRVLRKPSPIFVDPAKMKQVLLNLTTNAIEHGPPGQLVTIQLDCDDKQVTVEVRDQGKGITPQMQARLFEAFVQGADGKTGGERGSGLGLYIAHLLVGAHGGTLSVSSEIGQGSVFKVSLPVHGPSFLDNGTAAASSPLLP